MLKYLLYQLQKIISAVNPKGQINQATDIGKWIFFLSGLDTVKYIVEIGTYNGRGSTKIIANSVAKNSKSTLVFTLETDKDLYDLSRRYLSRYKFVFPIFGRCIDTSELDIENLEPHENDWLQKDLTNMSLAPNVIESLPKFIDLLVLDGGEFSTYGEFKKLENRVRQFVVIDDINTRKGRKIIGDIDKFKSFSIVHQTNERNGVLVLKKL